MKNPFKKTFSQKYGPAINTTVSLAVVGVSLVSMGVRIVKDWRHARVLKQQEAQLADEGYNVDGTVKKLRAAA